MQGNIKIVSYNLRSWGGDGDGINNFVHRIGPIFNKIHAVMPDIIGFQEVMPRQLVFLERLLTEYTLLGQFREADFLGEGLYVAVKKDAFQVLAFNTFWLSPTPYVPGSRFEQQSGCPRICNVLRLRHKESDKIFRLFNLHLDHVGEEARVKGMQCVLDELTALNNVAEFPAVILGDFNAGPSSVAIALCNQFQPYSLVDVTKGIPCTCHDFGRKNHVKIDYIFLSAALAENVTQVGIWDDEQNGSYLSDHYPVWVDVEF